LNNSETSTLLIHSMKPVEIAPTKLTGNHLLCKVRLEQLLHVHLGANDVDLARVLLVRLQVWHTFDTVRIAQLVRRMESGKLNETPRNTT